MKELDYEELNFLVKETIGEYDANEKYLAFKKKPSDINNLNLQYNSKIFGFFLEKHNLWKKKDLKKNLQ